jgi:hypothetical protein
MPEGALLHRGRSGVYSNYGDGIGFLSITLKQSPGLGSRGGHGDGPDGGLSGQLSSGLESSEVLRGGVCFA